MRYPVCKNSISMLKNKATPKGANFLYTCGSCNAELIWQASKALKGFLMFVVLSIVLGVVFDLLIPATGGLSTFFNFALPGGIAFALSYRVMFRLDALESNELSSPCATKDASLNKKPPPPAFGG